MMIITSPNADSQGVTMINYIINDIASEFGGGGHALAAGATIESDNVEELIKDIVYHLEKRINDGN